LSITDDVSDCIYPNNDVNFTVSYAANQDINDVNLAVELSPYLTFNYCTGSGVYNPSNRTVTWSLGDRTIGEFNGLPVPDYNSYTINCTVNFNAPEGWYIRTAAKLYSGQDLAEDAYVDTGICCSHDTLYVDDDAVPGGDGYSWDTALNNLQTALAVAGGSSCIDKILVAAGTYCPTTSTDPEPWGKTFQLIDGVDIYGGFKSCEETPDPNLRNLADASYASILTGDKNNDGYGDVSVVVTAADCKIDGFTIRKAANHGISCDEAATSISNCVFTNNAASGIYSDEANINVFNSFFKNNGYGIDSKNTALEVVQCTILNSSSSGLVITGQNTNSITNITDCIIGGNGDYGIYAGSASIAIRNCDVNDNDSDGIYFTPHRGLVERCEIYRNANNGIQIASASDANIINNKGISKNS
jgi:hypothetical protein